MIITIDGPAGAGKSTVAKRLAERLGFEYLDTGSMYRAVALAGLRKGVDWQSPDAVAAVAAEVDLRMEGGRTLLDGEDVTALVRSSQVTEVTRHTADNPVVRLRMAQLQREYGARHNAVTDGRDQGTAVFPDAVCKFFVTASPEERARRRRNELRTRGEDRPLATLQQEIEARDARDAARTVGPLLEPPDAARVVTDGMTIDQVVTSLERAVRDRLASLG